MLRRRRSHFGYRLATGGSAMALEADRGADGLIRQVQKVLGKASPAAAFAPLLYGRNGPRRPEQPAGRLARRQRPRGARVHRRQAEGPAQGPRPPHGRGRRRRAAGRRADRDRQRRHAVPRRLGAGRAAGPRHRRAPAPAPDLQDPARQGRPPAGHRAAPATTTGATATRKATSPSTSSALSGGGGARPRRYALRHPATRCASSSPTGSRCWQRLEAAVAASWSWRRTAFRATCWPSRSPF